MDEVASLLGRWHQWRRMYTHERAYARLAYEYAASTGDEDDELERIVMRSIEVEVAELPRDLQLALQHVARAECLGVEVVKHPGLNDSAVREPLVARALHELQRRLLHAGVI